MADDGKNLALVILGIVAIIAVIGLVLLFTKTSASGAIASRQVIESSFAREPIGECHRIDTTGRFINIQPVFDMAQFEEVQAALHRNPGEVGGGTVLAECVLY
jgi:hypothetical protein